MTTEQVWYVPITFESYTVAKSLEPIALLVNANRAVLSVGVHEDVVLARGNVGESLLNGSGLMELNISLRRIEDLLMDRFPDYVFKVDAKIDEEKYRVTCVTVSGKSLISEGELK